MDDKRSWQKGISIHTPTRGVTPFPPLSCCMTANFNPHSHKGSDARIAPLYGGYGYFNPHSHKGSDCSETGNKQIVIDFNPHSHKGSDKNTGTQTNSKSDFNPHSHKGSDWNYRHRCCFWIISIHTPTRGVTVIGKSIEQSQSLFQSTLPQGE